MRFTDIFVRRPVLASVISLLILLIGLRSVFMMDLREYPETKSTVVTVRTAYPGASAELIQGYVTTPLQAAVAEAEGIDYISSTSTQGRPATSSAGVGLSLVVKTCSMSRSKPCAASAASA